MRTHWLAFKCAISGLLFFILSVQAHAQSSWTELEATLTTLFDNEDYQGIIEQKDRIEKAIEGLEGKQTVTVLSMLGEAYIYEGMPEEGLAFMEKAYAHCQNPNCNDYGDLLFNMAVAHQELGNYQKALDMTQVLLKEDKAQYGAESEEYLGTATTLGELYEQIGNFEKAEGFFSKMIKETPETAGVNVVWYSGLGNALLAQGQVLNAEPYFLKAVDIAENQPELDLSLLGKTMVNLADYYYFAGSYGKAETVYNEAFALSDEATEDPLESFYPTLLNNMGLMYNRMGNYQKAQGLLLELEGIDKSSYGEDHPYYAATLLNLGTVYRSEKAYAKAQQCYEKALEVNKANFGPKHPETIKVQTNLANLYRMQGQPNKATALYSSVQKNAKKAFGKNNPQYARVLKDAGVSFMAANDAKNAQKYLVQAKDILANQLGPQHPRYGTVSKNLAWYHWQQAQPNNAAQWFDSAFTNYYGQINTFFGVMSEEEKARFYNNTLQLAFESFNSFAVQHVQQMPALLDRMFNLRLNTKSLIFYSTASIRRQINATGNPNLINKYSQWLDLREQLALYYTLSKEALEKRGVNLAQVQAQINGLEKELSQEVSSFAGAIKPIAGNTWQEVRASLNKGEAAIEMIRFRVFSPENAGNFSGPVQYAALVVRHDTQEHPELVLFENGLAMEGKFLNNYRNSIIYQLQEGYSYEQFWAPLQPKLNSIKRVYFSPDGLYNQVSLNTLYNPATNRYLLEDVEVQRVNNIKDLIGRKKVDTRTGGVYLFGYPDYDQGVDTTSQQYQSVVKQIAATAGMNEDLRGTLQEYAQNNRLLKLLPGTKAEVERIEGLYKAKQQAPTTFMNDAANESSIKSIAGPKTLHIATHGFFLEDPPKPEPGSENRYVGNPLLRSGLILAGANNFLLTGNLNEQNSDGILTAYEAMNLELSNTELVVLSACETGLGTVENGEGVYGLQRAFQVAGAETVVMSLWSVDDHATQALMDLFYQYWLGGMNKQQAFRKAQLTLKETYEEPFYWGAFVLSGLEG